VTAALSPNGVTAAEGLAPSRPDLTPLSLLLMSHGLDPASLVVSYNDLHPADVGRDFRTMADVIAANAHHLLDRMQDGPLIAHDALVLSFAARGDGRAVLFGFRRFLMRRPGIVPADIVYDEAAAHLLHGFIARAAQPVFYDACDEDGAAELMDRLTIVWPDCGTTLLRASDPRIVVAGCAAD
jgi:hypothetical protein